MKKILLALLLVGCQSTPTQQVEAVKESPEAIKIREAQEAKQLSTKIDKLNDAGTGTINVCGGGSYSSMSISYDNQFGKNVLLRVNDSYNVNRVYMYLNKKRSIEFIAFLMQGQKKSENNKEIENLDLGQFKEGNNWLMLTSYSGKLSGYWGNEWVDRVSRTMNSNWLISCIKKIKPHL